MIHIRIVRRFPELEIKNIDDCKKALKECWINVEKVNLAELERQWVYLNSF